MFRFLNRTSTEKVSMTIDHQPVDVPAGCSVWAAMASQHIVVSGCSPVTGSPRSAYCGMGVCFECLVEIDGVSNQQACLTTVREGMHVRLQTFSETTVKPQGT